MLHSLPGSASIILASALAALRAALSVESIHVTCVYVLFSYNVDTMYKSNLYVYQVSFEGLPNGANATKSEKCTLKLLKDPLLIGL